MLFFPVRRFHLMPSLVTAMARYTSAPQPPSPRSALPQTLKPTEVTGQQFRDATVIRRLGIFEDAGLGDHPSVACQRLPSRPMDLASRSTRPPPPFRRQMVRRHPIQRRRHGPLSLRQGKRNPREVGDGTSLNALSLKPCFAKDDAGSENRFEWHYAKGRWALIHIETFVLRGFQQKTAKAGQFNGMHPGGSGYKMRTSA